MGQAKKFNYILFSWGSDIIFRLPWLKYWPYGVLIRCWKILAHSPNSLYKAKIRQKKKLKSLLSILDTMEWSKKPSHATIPLSQKGTLIFKVPYKTIWSWGWSRSRNSLLRLLGAGAERNIFGSAKLLFWQTQNNFLFFRELEEKNRTLSENPGLLQLYKVKIGL